MERLPQPHLVGKDAVDAVLVQVRQPVEAQHLVRAHAAVILVDQLGLLGDADLLLKASGARAARAAVEDGHHLLVLLLLALAPLLLLLLVRIQTEVLEEVRLAEQEGQPLLRRLVHVAHDGLVLRLKLLLVVGELAYLLRSLGLLGARSRVGLHARALRGPLLLTFRRAGRCLLQLGLVLRLLLVERRLVHAVLFLEAMLVGLCELLVVRFVLNLGPLFTHPLGHHLRVGGAQLSLRRIAHLLIEEHPRTQRLMSDGAKAVPRASGTTLALRGEAKRAQRPRGAGQQCSADRAAYRLGLRVCELLNLPRLALELLSDRVDALLVGEHAARLALLMIVQRHGRAPLPSVARRGGG